MIRASVGEDRLYDRKCFEIGLHRFEIGAHRFEIGLHRFEIGAHLLKIGLHRCRDRKKLSLSLSLKRNRSSCRFAPAAAKPKQE